MKFQALALVAALFLATPAVAADDTAPKPNEGQMAAAMDLLEADGTAANLGAMLDAMAPLQAMSIQRAAPNLSAEDIAALQTAIKTALLAHLDELKRIVASGYAAHFSESELKTLAAFYRSDTGRKYIATVPVLLKELSPAETAWTIGIVQDVAKKALASHKTGDHA